MIEIGAFKIRTLGDLSKREAIYIGWLLGLITAGTALLILQPTLEQYCGAFESCIPI